MICWPNLKKMKIRYLITIENITKKLIGFFLLKAMEHFIISRGGLTWKVHYFIISNNYYY